MYIERWRIGKREEEVDREEERKKYLPGISSPSPCFLNFVLAILYDKQKVRGGAEKDARGPRGGKRRYFPQDRMICDCHRLSSSRIGERRAKRRGVSAPVPSETKEKRRKGHTTSLSEGSLAPIAPVDSRNIFARLTEPFGRLLLVRPIDVWARLLSDLLLAPAFVFFRSGMRRPRLTLLGGRWKAGPPPGVRFKGDTIKLLIKSLIISPSQMNDRRG